MASPDIEGTGAAPGDPSATGRLLALARHGDRQALDQLFARCGPELRRFARGRLPRWARDIADTTDLVQDTLLQTFKQLGRFQDRGDGAFRAYLRQAVLNRIHDGMRRAFRRPVSVALSARVPDLRRSPLEAAIGQERVEQYEAALARLGDRDRALVIARVEMGLSYPEIAASMRRRPSANGARMAVVRALLRLTEELAYVRRTATE